MRCYLILYDAWTQRAVSASIFFKLIHIPHIKRKNHLTSSL